MKFNLIDLDEKEKEDLKSGNGFILDTSINYLKLHQNHILLKNSIYSRKFDISESDPEEVISYLYSCKCEDLLGQLKVGVTCPRCETEVKKKEFPVTKRAWGVIKPFKIMTYAGLLHLKNVLVNKDFKKFLNDKIKGFDKVDMYERFEAFLDEYGKSDKEKEKKFLIKNKEKVFTSYIPVISKKLRPILRQFNIIPQFTMLDRINSIYTSISQDIQTLKDFCIGGDVKKMTNSTLTSIQKKVYKMGQYIDKKIGGDKEKLVRNKIYATRLPFTARAVIVPLVTNKLDICTIPYDTFRGLFRREIMDILLESDMPMHKVYNFININKALKEEDRRILDDILKNKIKNPYILINRQPTLKFESTRSLKIDQLEREKVLRVPSVLLDGWNGDHDGDELTMVHQPIELYPRIHPYMQPKVHILDYKREVNHGFGPIKSQSIIFYKSLDDK